MPRLPLAKVIDRLGKAHGIPRAPRSTDPWSLILRENVAYLADATRSARRRTSNRGRSATPCDRR